MSTSPQVTFLQSAGQVDAYDFIEVTLRLEGAPPENPFTQVSVSGDFQQFGRERIQVQGFCDSLDGRLYRVRFMPAQPGDYAYRITFQWGAFEQSHTGSFHVMDAGRRGLVRVDPAFPYHFQYAGTAEHYFWNATTAYALMGWQEEVIYQILDRLHRLQINRIRVGLSSARVELGRAWFEAVFPSEQFTFLTNPWVAERPESVADPGFDPLRYNVAYWQKFEHLLRYARQRDIQVSVVFYVDGYRPGVDPFGPQRKGGWEEQHFYRYAMARFGAFSNVMWDITNEWRLFRDENWVEWMGNLFELYDPYAHLTSCHGHEFFPFKASPWADFTMYQQWDESGGNAPMLARRADQVASGHLKPVINEEFGYEDHYPGYGGGKQPPARSADNRRRLAWEIVMAGCYATTGERAVPLGGWINGRGADDTMLTGYSHMLTFFTSFPWWQMQPHNELVDGWNLCLAEPGQQYVVYMPRGGAVTVSLAPGRYQAGWYNPRQGQSQPVGLIDASGPWTSPAAPDSEDWALRLERVTPK